MCGGHGVRVFIVYHSPVFALGVRGFLAGTPGIDIAGMELESAASLDVARSLQPDAVIIEQPLHDASRLQALLDIPTVARVVTMTLEHETAAVYLVRRLRVAEPSALAAAISLQNCRRTSKASRHGRR